MQESNIGRVIRWDEVKHGMLVRSDPGTQPVRDEERPLLRDLAYAHAGIEIKNGKEALVAARIAGRLLRRVRDFALVQKAAPVTREIAALRFGPYTTYSRIDATNEAF